MIEDTVTYDTQAPEEWLAHACASFPNVGNSDGFFLPPIGLDSDQIQFRPNKNKLVSKDLGSGKKNNQRGAGFSVTVVTGDNWSNARRDSHIKFEFQTW
jgi:hypothetical protein